jgi:RNase P protein component
MAPERAANSSASRKKNPRSGRLLRHADFERVYKQGRRHFSAHMTVFYLGRAEGEGLRVGLTRPAIAPAADVVINPKKSLQTAEFSLLLAEVSRAFEVIAQKLSEKPRPMQ